MTVLGSPRLLFVSAASMSLMSSLVTVAAGPMVGATVALVPAILVIGGLMASRRQPTPASTALAGKLTGAVEAGRRLAMYDQETGLLAPWYLAVRGDEECDRAARYDRPLTLLLVETTPQADDEMMPARLTDWLKRELRSADVSGYLGRGRFVVLMPETGGSGAWRLVERLHRDVEDAVAALSRFPADGASYAELYDAASQRLTTPLQRAA